MQSKLQELATEGMAWVSLGQVTAVEAHDSYSYLLTLSLVDDGRTVQARPMWLMGGRQGEGVYSRIEVGDEAVVLMPSADPNRAVALIGPASGPAKPPSGWANDKLELVDRGGVEVRTAEGATVQPVLLADLDTNLANALTEISALLKILGLPTPVTDTLVSQLNALNWRSAALKAE